MKPMTDAEWERRVLLEINQMRRFLGVPRELYKISDLAVAQLWTLVLAILTLIVAVWPTTVYLIVASFLVRLVWVILSTK
jgi:hypothetical protein